MPCTRDLISLLRFVKIILKNFNEAHSKKVKIYSAVNNKKMFYIARLKAYTHTMRLYKWMKSDTSMYYLSYLLTMKKTIPKKKDMYYLITSYNWILLVHIQGFYLIYLSKQWSRNVSVTLKICDSLK